METESLWTVLLLMLTGYANTYNNTIISDLQTLQARPQSETLELTNLMCPRDLKRRRKIERH